MTPEERIDAAIRSIFDAGGIYINIYTSEQRRADMREAMRKIMSDSYISGSNDCFNAMQNSSELEIAFVQGVAWW